MIQSIPSSSAAKPAGWNGDSGRNSTTRRPDTASASLGKHDLEDDFRCSSAKIRANCRDQATLDVASAPQLCRAGVCSDIRAGPGPVSVAMLNPGPLRRPSLSGDAGLTNTVRLIVAMGVCALLWGGSVMAAPAGTSDPIVPLAVAGPASAQSPSIDILANQSQLAGTCGGQTFDLNTFINVDAQASADVKLSVV